MRWRRQNKLCQQNQQDNIFGKQSKTPTAIPTSINKHKRVCIIVLVCRNKTIMLNANIFFIIIIIWPIRCENNAYEYCIFLLIGLSCQFKFKWNNIESEQIGSEKNKNQINGLTPFFLLSISPWLSHEKCDFTSLYFPKLQKIKNIYDFQFALLFCVRVSYLTLTPFSIFIIQYFFKFFCICNRFRC